MVSVTVARPLRQYGYDVFDALTGGVRPVEGGLRKNADGSLTVTFPDPADPADPPLVDPATLTLVAEWLESRDDAELALRREVAAAVRAVSAWLTQPPSSSSPTAEQTTALTRAVVCLARLLGIAPTPPTTGA